MLLQSILTLQPTSQARRNEKQLGFRVHRLVNLALVLPLFTVGASIMWYLHDQPGQKHFISWHGILGTVIIAWAWLQVAFGIVVTSFDGNLVGGISNAKALWKHHRYVGFTPWPTLVSQTLLSHRQVVRLPTAASVGCCRVPGRRTDKLVSDVCRHGTSYGCPALSPRHHDRSVCPCATL